MTVVGAGFSRLPTDEPAPGDMEMASMGTEGGRSLLPTLAMLVLASIATTGEVGPPTTLRALLERERVDQAGLALLPDLPLDRAISDYAVTNTPQVFAVAFFWDDVVQQARALPDQFEILLLDKTAARWRRATLSADHLPKADGTLRLGLWGSIVGITHAPQHLLVEAHVSPSATVTLVLTRSLEPKAMFYGWPLFSLPSGSIAYYRSHPHFAPTHPFELYVFDPVTGADRMVYPLKPYDEPRRAFIEQMRVAYAKAGDAWCRERNHHCDPERFDSSGGREWAVDPGGSAMAFLAIFGNAPGGRGNSPDDEVPSMEVVVVCRNTQRIDAMVCRETPLETLQRANPGVPVRGLLQLAIAAPPR